MDRYRYVYKRQTSHSWKRTCVYVYVHIWCYIAITLGVDLSVAFTGSSLWHRLERAHLLPASDSGSVQLLIFCLANTLYLWKQERAQDAICKDFFWPDRAANWPHLYAQSLLNDFFPEMLRSRFVILALGLFEPLLFFFFFSLSSTLDDVLATINIMWDLQPLNIMPSINSGV